MGDARLEAVAGDAHSGGVLDEAGVGVIAQFREEGRQGISTGKELDILTSEVIVFLEHAATSIF
jgi:hypothetical protein